RIDDLLGLLRSERDYATIRDLCESWLRAVLATPLESDPYQRGRRAAFLARYTSVLAGLPEELPFDAELAVRAGEEAVALEPVRYEVLARVYEHLGRIDLAAEHLAQGARRFASDPRALNNFAWFLATTRAPQLRDPARAVELARRAVGLSA